MGTSKGFSTPTGGPWRPLKTHISNYLDGSSSVTPAQLVGGTVSAIGVGLSRLGAPSGGSVGSISGSRAGGGGGGGGGARGGGRGSRSGRSVGGAVAGLAGFGSAVRSGGLTEAITRLGLPELRDRSAAEVLALVAERIASQAEGPQREVITAALLALLFEAAEIQGSEDYADLEAALSSFLEQNGLDGLVESFLTKCVYEGIWFAIEEHIGMKSETNADTKTMAMAMEGVCRSEVRAALADAKTTGTFETTDWFGSDGQSLAETIVHELESRLCSLEHAA